MEKRYTLKDVAKEAKVSVGTVSNYLNNPNSVKPVNRIQIERAVELLGFTPNVNARILATGKSKTVVLYIHSEKTISPTTWLHQLPTVQTVHDMLHREGYVLQIRIVYASDEDDFYASVRNCVESKAADGILLLSVWEIPAKIVKYLLNRDFPFVCLGNRCFDPDATSIYCDNYGMMCSLVDLLYQKGHRNIAYITVQSKQQDVYFRYQGYLDGLKEHNLTVHENYILYGDFSIESGRKCMLNALKQNLGFTAVLCANDNMAVGAIQAITEMGLRVPEDVSLMGVDNSIAANACTPRLHTVEFDLESLGRFSVRELLRMIQNRAYRPTRIKLGFNVVSGKTVGLADVEVREKG